MSGVEPDAPRSAGLGLPIAEPSRVVAVLALRSTASRGLVMLSDLGYEAPLASNILDPLIGARPAMATVLLVIHLMIAAAMVFIVLIQKSEGGALGIGGGGGLLAGRGKANLMTRATATLAAAFFATSLLLTIISQSGQQGSVIDKTPAPTGQAAPASGAAPGAATPAPSGGEAPASDQPRGGILDKLR
jgi:preprotein translocase subunit SecG